MFGAVAYEWGQARQAEQYAQAQKQYAEWVNLTTLLAEDHQKMGAHITKLTNAYDNLSADLRELFR